MRISDWSSDVCSSDLTWLAPIQENVAPAIPFLVLFGVIVLVPSLRREVSASDPLAGVDPPPVGTAKGIEDPRRTMITRLVGTAVLFGLAAVVFTQADAVWLFLITQTLVLSIVFPIGRASWRERVCPYV